MKKINRIKVGFTMIELLIVIAIMGVLASVVVVAINPIQQMARARDAGRKDAIGQLGTALTSYYTTNGAYVTPSGTWIDTLVAAGEIKSPPAAIVYSVTGTASCLALATATPPSYVDNDYCYSATAATFVESVVYARLESASEVGACTVLLPNAYWVYSSTSGKACKSKCLAAGAAFEPKVGFTTTDCI